MRNTPNVEPPLIPLAMIVNSLPGPPVEGITVHLPPDIRQSFSDYVGRAPADLDARPFGMWVHFADNYRNAVTADYAVRELAKLIIDRGGDAVANVRANDAGVLLLVASHLLNTASIVHVRSDETTHAHGLILSRSALECVGRAALLAFGVGDEVQRWHDKEEFKAADCIRALVPVVARSRPTASSPQVVYKWLCHFTHMNVQGIERIQSKDPAIRDESYCGHAYVSWLTAVLAERVTGLTDLARYPSALPEKLPWDC